MTTTQRAYKNLFNTQSTASHPFISEIEVFDAYFPLTPPPGPACQPKSVNFLGVTDFNLANYRNPTDFFLLLPIMDVVDVDGT